MLYATMIILSAAGYHILFSYRDAAKRRKTLAERRRQNRPR
jgi:hypothetical protein